jgi:penicillin-binding protein-related factor A (putative recombinase)
MRTKANSGNPIKRRGSELGNSFQELVNRTNLAYAQLGRAYITRKSIPGKYVAAPRSKRRGLQINAPDLTATLPAHSRLSSAQLLNLVTAPADLRRFVPESKAEPDYGGALAPSGRAIFYDAKTTVRERLDFDNLHPHQIFFLENIAAMGAIAGFLVEFSRYQQVFFLPIQLVPRYRQQTGYKSIPWRFFQAQLIPAPSGKGLLLFDYLTAIEAQENRYQRDYTGLQIA